MAEHNALIQATRSLFRTNLCCHRSCAFSRDSGHNFLLDHDVVFDSDDIALALRAHGAVFTLLIRAQSGVKQNCATVTPGGMDR